MIVEAEIASGDEKCAGLFVEPRSESHRIHVEIELDKAGCAAFRLDKGKTGFVFDPFFYIGEVFQTDAAVSGKDRVAVFQSDARQQIVDFSDADHMIISVLIDPGDEVCGTGNPAEADAGKRKCF